ncbi:MAG: helicase-associated domain-containing protein [bacterium]|nr:helicase-associated domain-containing protein [bacterium]
MFAHWLPATQLRHRKEEQVLLYLQALTDSTRRARVLERLEPAARALLTRCAANEGQSPIGVLLARTSSAGYDVTPATLASLHYCGCAFLDSPVYWPRGTAWTLEHTHQGVIVPVAIATACSVDERIPLHIPRCQTHMPADADSAAVRSAALISECLQAVSDGAIRMTQDDVFAVRTQRLLADLWARHGCHTAPSAQMICAYLRSAGIVQRESNGALAPTASFASERERPVLEHLAALLEYELTSLGATIKEATTYGFSPRAYVADTLKSMLLPLSPGEGIRVAECCELVHARAHAMSRGGGGVRGWNWPRSTQPIPSQPAWNALVRDLIERLFSPYGVLAICEHCPQGPCVVLTDFGHFWLHGTTAPRPPHEHQQLIVQPDFTAVLTHTGPWDRTAHVLRIFGSQHGDHNVSTFRFTRERVQAAARHGHNVQELLALLAARATYPVPDNVRITLQEWGNPATDALLHRDANLLSFDSRDARDAFLQRRVCAAQPLGERFALLSVPERVALDVMQQLGALPVDYAQPPVAGLAILPDGTVNSPAVCDLRIAALRDAIAVPIPPSPERPETHWRVSARRVQSCQDPAFLFHQLARLPGSPLPLVTRLYLLVLLKLVPRDAQDKYIVIDTLPTATWTRLKQRISWRTAVLFDGTPSIAVIAPAHAQTVRVACDSLAIHVHELSLNPPPFQTYE